MRRLNQRGFAVIEALLLVVLFSIIGGAGWYMVKASNDISKTNDSTTKSSISAPSKPKKKIVPVKKTFTPLSTETKEEGVYVNVIQADETVTNVSPNAIAKTADQVGILKSLHLLCTDPKASFVSVNHAVFDGGPNFKIDGNYAEINAGRCAAPAKILDEVGGSGTATYLYKSKADTWVYDFSSQMGVPCSNADGKNYPVSIIPTCFEDTDPTTTRAPK